MNWRTVDMSRESRRDQFAYFQTLSNPYVGVTVQVDVTELAVWCRERGTSFFLAVLYAAVRAANGVPELRRRIRGDQVVEYDRCPSSHTVALPDGTYCYCSLEVDRPFREFLPYAAQTMPRGLYAGRSARSPCGSEGAYLFGGPCPFRGFQRRSGSRQRRCRTGRRILCRRRFLFLPLPGRDPASA